jgi:hypothetical protein
LLFSGPVAESGIVYQGCGFYYDLFANMPGGLANTTGIFEKNVDFLSSIVAAAVSGPPCDQPLLPFGPPDN